MRRRLRALIDGLCRRERAASFQEFITLLQKQECRHVEAYGSREVNGGAFTATVGTIGDFVYVHHYRSKSPSGQTLVYSEQVLVRFGSEHGFADGRERGLAALRSLVTLDARLERIRREVRGIDIRLTNGADQEFSAKDFTRLRHDAEKHSVSPVPVEECQPNP